MTGARQVLFVQGGGEDVHDAWDAELVDSLRQHLGDGWEVRYPRMPDEADPSYAAWSEAIRGEVAALDDGAVVAGHSVGAAVLVRTLAERAPPRRLGAIVLVAAPFVGPGGWPGDGFTTPEDLGARLPPGTPVHVFHGLQDETAPSAHAELYARAIPQARLHLLPGLDHQLGGDLSEVAARIRSVADGDSWRRQVRRVHVVEYQPADQDLSREQIDAFLSRANTELSGLGPHVTVQAGIDPGVSFTFWHRNPPYDVGEDIGARTWEDIVLRVLAHLDAQGSVTLRTFTAVVPRSALRRRAEAEPEDDEE